MTENKAKQPQENSTKEKVTVSIRSMNKQLWIRAGYEAKRQGMTMTQYISKLIEKDISNS